MLSPLLAVLLPLALQLAHTTPSTRFAADHRTRALVTLRGGELTSAEETAKQQWLAGVRGSVVPTAGGPVIEWYPGHPKAVLVPPGRCVFGEEWAPAPLLSREWIGHDTALLTFGLKDGKKPLGLSTCACLLARGAPLHAGGDAVVRPYTPVSTNAMLGAFQLVVKVYPGGAMSEQLARVPIGATVDFKHIQFNVKLQYPFRARHIVMLCGGTGIAPMLQALHALLGTPHDGSYITLLYSSKTEDDIIAKGTLAAWEAMHHHRFRVQNTLTREPEGTGWFGRRGRIDATLLREYLPPPSEDVLIFVCGPPAMYDTLSGPRGEEGLSGLLAEMGYHPRQVVKF